VGLVEVAGQAATAGENRVMAKFPTGFSLANRIFREEDGRWLADIAALRA